MTTFEQRMNILVADVFGLRPEEVTPETSHETVENWDSLNIIRLVMAVEAEFRVTISPDEAVDFLSVKRISAILRDKGAK